jgi:hypothetical protein
MATSFQESSVDKQSAEHIRSFAASLAAAGSDLAASVRQAKERIGENPVLDRLAKICLTLNCHAERMEAAAEKAAAPAIQEDSRLAEAMVLLAAQQAIIMAQAGIIRNRKRRMRKLGLVRVRYLLSLRAGLAVASLMRRLLIAKIQGCHYGK